MASAIPGWIAQDFGGGDTDDGQPLRFGPSGSCIVTLWPIAHVVGDAVHLDRDAGRGTIEIEHERPERVPAAEFRVAVRSWFQSRRSGRDIERRRWRAWVTDMLRNPPSA